MKKHPTSFRDFDIPGALIKALDKMKFFEPTPVQAEAIPPALKGRDILGTAQTGTGKTGAFGIPLLTRIYDSPYKMAVVLTPTRELAAQIDTVLSKMASSLRMRGAIIVGGESFGRQVNQIQKGIDYIVATPGRLNDHLKEGTISLRDVNFLVLDEVDRMLDMGFAPQIKRIMRHVPKRRQTLLFSATMPASAARLANTLLNKPIRIAIEPAKESAGKVEIETVVVSQQKKTQRILTELKKRKGKILIFTRTKIRADSLANILSKQGHKISCLHGGRTQGERKRALEAFSTGKHRVMVATDIAGRGIDVKDIAHVINFDLPKNREDYIHRIGRTGRYGKSGKVLNLRSAVEFDWKQILMESEFEEGKATIRKFSGRFREKPKKE